MLVIPGGEIVLRDDRIKKTWEVEIVPFSLAEFAVTQDIYFAIMHCNPSAFKGPRRPVENVSWNDAIAFCNALSKKEGLPEFYFVDNNGEVKIKNPNAIGYRLPTDAEWQYACKAGTDKVRYGDLDQIAWYKGNADACTHEVDSKMPNAWGLFDMLGNVWEWCWDLYDEEVYGSYRIFRGGGWNDPERGCLATNRRRGHPDFKIDDLGFRLAQSL